MVYAAMSAGQVRSPEHVLRCFSTTIQSCPTSRDTVNIRVIRVRTPNLSHTTCHLLICSSYQLHITDVDRTYGQVLVAKIGDGIHNRLINIKLAPRWSFAGLDPASVLGYSTKDNG